MKEELARLRRDLAQARSEFTNSHAAQLLEANERLVVSAMNAELVAETAVSRLGDLTRSTQRDPLTDTPNRTTMLDRIQGAIDLARRHAGRCAVIFVDVDDFKLINDTYGHAVGDDMLRVIARRLDSATRKSDSVSRHGGDEFLILLPEISQPSDVSFIAAKMLALLAEPVDRYAFSLSASLGVAVFPEHGDDTETLVRNADAAMYAAKAKGGNCCEFFQDFMPSAFGQDEHGPGESSPTMKTLASGPVERQMRNLREANQRLIVTSLAAQESEAACRGLRRHHEKFLSMVAHELRNPLTPISASASLLTSVNGDEQALRRIQSVIQRQVGFLSRLVDDLLDRARATEGKFRIESQAVELGQVLELAVQTCRGGIEARLQSLDLEMPREKLIVNGDPVRLAQVFSNLLDNASKYTRTAGQIRLSATANGRYVECMVVDDGIGIESSTLPHIFDLFVQDPHATTVHSGGLGIGLSIVKGLVEAHGGTVTASSAGRDQGSAFLVRLPRVDNSHPDLG